MVRRVGSLEGRLAVEIEAFAPDRRRRDLDGMLKVPLDALAIAGVYSDDSQIDDLRIVRREPDGEPRLVVRITEIKD